MTAFRTVVVLCDTETASGPCVMKRTTSATTMAKAREEVALYGWTHYQFRSGHIADYCPDHKAPGPIYEVKPSPSTTERQEPE